jgi:myo-inositol-1-phosphate synthase
MLDIEKLLREGKTLDEIGKIVSEELNDAQSKIDAENEKKAAAAKEKEALNNAKDAAITALMNYIALVSPKTAKEVELVEVLNESLDSLVEGLKLIDNLTIKYNGKTFSIFDL